MGAKDTKTKEFLSDNERFADLFNYFLFDGKDIIQAEDLEERDTTEVLSVYGFSQKELQVQKWRDLIKSAIIKVSDDACYVLLGVENQSEISYAMPVKDMIYAAINYGSQVNEAAKKHKADKEQMTSAEFLSGFKKEDKLIPVITLTVLWAAGKWDGPMGLHDMLVPINQELLKFIPDYRINLLVPDDIQEFDKFKTSLGPVLEVVKASGSKQEMDMVIRDNPAFENLENDAVATINVVTSMEVKINEKGGTTNMCKAWEDQKLEGKIEGKIEGIMAYIQYCVEKNETFDNVIATTMQIFKISREDAEKYYAECALQTV